MDNNNVCAVEIPLGEDVKEKNFQPKFCELIYLLHELCERGYLQKDPENSNNVLIYRQDMDPEVYGTTEGWWSENIFSVASELFQAFKDGDDSLFLALKAKGIHPLFTEDGCFVGIEEVSLSN